MQITNLDLKAEAQRLVEQLPENSTWDDLMYEIYVRQAIEAGVKDSAAGKIISVEKLREKFGLSK